MATSLNLAAYERSLHLARAATGGLLKRGASDKKAIRALQDRLSNLGFALENDGIYGEKTEAAVKRLQKKYGAKQDGVVGPETLGKLIRAKRPRPNAAAVGLDEVERVVGKGEALPETTGQSMGNLRARQRGGGTTPDYGGRARSARAKRKAGKTASDTPEGPHGGKIDPYTGVEKASSTTGPIGSTDPSKPSAVGQQQLREQKGAKPVPGQPTNPEFEKLHPRGTGEKGGQFVAKGSEGSQVTAVQAQLNRTGIKPKVKEDGDFGDMTEQAVREFQKSEGNLEVDGIVGPKTTAAIRRAVRNNRRG